MLAAMPPWAEGLARHETDIAATGAGSRCGQGSGQSRSSRLRLRGLRMITARNRTLGQLQMLQVRSAGPPFIADSRAGCGKDWVIVGQGGFRSFAACSTKGSFGYVKPLEGRLEFCPCQTLHRQNTESGKETTLYS